VERSDVTDYPIDRSLAKPSWNQVGEERVILYFELQSVHCQIENLLFPGRVIDLLSLRGEGQRRYLLFSAAR